jgi:hypothetical protein
MNKAMQATQKVELESRIRSSGYALRYVEYCEDSRTPGFLGMIRGVVDHERREVKISLAANKTPSDVIDVLTHELRHIEEPEWDCGNRDVFGRGSVRTAKVAAA